MPLLRLIAILSCLLLLAACNSTRLAYNNLNWLIGWKVSDYIPLNSEQKTWLSEEVKAHQAWHCSTEIPRYRPMLANLQSTLETDKLDAAQLMDQIPQLEPAVDRLLVEVAPTMAELFKQLDDVQLSALKANLAEQHEEMVEKFAGPDAATQAKERSERLEKRLNRWLGRLNEAQRARIESWSAGLEDQNRIWLDNRQQWQQQLLTTLETQREAEDFNDQISQLLVERERYWTDDFIQRSEINTRAGAQMLADVMNTATDTQRSRMAQQFTKLDRDLQQMQCESPSSQT